MTTPVTSSSSTTTSLFSSSDSSSNTTGLASDFETFLLLLTTQAENQDPLEPIDSTEYASQLAQFSMVEQQVQGNELLSGMQAQLALNAMATVTQWVGMEARAPVSGYFDGASAITVAPNPPASADEVQLVVRDADGRQVNSIPLSVSSDNYEWDGTDSDGNLVEAGAYSFTLQSYRDEELIETSTAEIYSRIRESQIVDNQVVLIMNGGSAINSTDVTALREPNV